MAVRLLWNDSPPVEIKDSIEAMMNSEGRDHIFCAGYVGWRARIEIFGACRCNPHGYGVGANLRPPRAIGLPQCQCQEARYDWLTGHTGFTVPESISWHS